jgi:hypothetical protein
MMAEVYKLWQSRRMNEAWYQLSPQEQQSLMNRLSESLHSVGGRELVLCDASWSNEGWPVFGLETFPDVAAVQRHGAFLAEIGWGRYRESRSTLGIEVWRSLLLRSDRSE